MQTALSFQKSAAAWWPGAGCSSGEFARTRRAEKVVVEEVRLTSLHQANSLQSMLSAFVQQNDQTQEIMGSESIIVKQN